MLKTKEKRRKIIRKWFIYFDINNKLVSMILNNNNLEKSKLAKYELLPWWVCHSVKWQCIKHAYILIIFIFFNPQTFGATIQWNSILCTYLICIGWCVQQTVTSVILLSSHICCRLQDYYINNNFLLFSYNKTAGQNELRWSLQTK